MRSKRARFVCALLFAIVVSGMPRAVATPYRAFSLKQAENLLLKKNSPVAADVRRLGGITRPVGCVFDEANKDVVIIGQADPALPPIYIDDLTVAMRAALTYGQEPSVSIDPAPDQSHKQPVRFEGKLENTRFGKDLLEADVVLKKLALGVLNAEVWGVRSYLDLSVEDWRRNKASDRTCSRFWFLTDDESSAIASRSGVGLVKRVKIKVRTEAVGTNGGTVATDMTGDAFAGTLTTAIGDVMVAIPEVKRLDQLYRLVGVVSVMEHWRDKCGFSTSALGLDYWLNGASIESIPTPLEYALLSRSSEVPGGQTMTLSGGVELRALVADVRGGALSALHDLVIKSRTSDTELTWSVPIGDALDLIADVEPQTAVSPPRAQETLGMYMWKAVSTRGMSANPISDSFLMGVSTHASSTPVSRFRALPYNEDLVSRSRVGGVPQSRIGGVMLSEKAKIAGANGRVDLSDGGFSLVVDGANAAVSDADFARFVTALWAVYYCKQAPGISIDPIDPSVDKHLVRYIGQVINSDLGRVMREADYHMKKVVMGIERPTIPGFQTPEDWMAEHRELYLAYRRFWFVPEQMEFREGNGMLLYDHGAMRLKTELMSDDPTIKSTPADEAFTEFYTKHYDEFSKQYPIYGELFDYAKMVALGRYLKSQGVPLHWFLLANRDRVLTEDSPGTVVELARKSTNFEGVEIKGGVDLGTQGHYVRDAEATKAILTAMASHKQPANDTDSQPSATTGSKPAVQEKTTAQDVYSAVPQKSLTSGRDSRGLRYQTDLAFRMEGEPALELVRYFDARKGNHGMFGNGWDMLLPYRVLLSKERRKISVGDSEIIGPATANVLDLLSGTTEELGFDPKRYGNLGYVPPTGSTTKTVGLFVTDEGAIGAADDQSVPAYRLADKIGNEFTFDQRGLMTGMVLGEEHRLTYTYARKDTRTIVRPSVKIRPVDGSGIVEINGYALPGRLVLTDMDGATGLVLVAQPDGRYLPDPSVPTSVKIGVASDDGRLTTEDDQGNQVVFAPGGAVESISFSDSTNVVQTMRYERLVPAEGETGVYVASPGQDIDFEFFIDLTGAVRVGRANVTCHAPEKKLVLRYQYDSQGWLIGVTRERVD